MAHTNTKIYKYNKKFRRPHTTPLVVWVVSLSKSCRGCSLNVASVGLVSSVVIVILIVVVVVVVVVGVCSGVDVIFIIVVALLIRSAVFKVVV